MLLTENSEVEGKGLSGLPKISMAIPLKGTRGKWMDFYHWTFTCTKFELFLRCK